MRTRSSKRVKYVPSIRDSDADKAIVAEDGWMQEKLHKFKVKYPELEGIVPASSPEELLNKIRIDSDANR